MLRKLLPEERLFRFSKVATILRKISDRHGYGDSTAGNSQVSFSTEYRDKTREAITNNTTVTRDHLTPEISLHLLTPSCSLYNAPIDRNFDKYYDSVTTDTFREPFWSIYWPGGQALARFVLDHGDELFSKGNLNVLDLGSGCGATAIAAKLRGAHYVVANDIDPVACVAAEMNAALNDIRLTTTRDNLLAKPYAETIFDVVLVGDLFYDDDIAAVLETWLDEAIRHGARIYIGDPGRHGVTKNLRTRLKKLESYSLPDNVRRENYGFDSATVWEFLKISN